MNTKGIDDVAQGVKAKAGKKATTAKAVVEAVTPRKSTPGTFTPQKRAQFLELFATGGSVRQHAKTVGVSVVTVFNHRRTDADFEAGFKKACETNTDVLEDMLYEMACAGNVAALFGTLKARRPERWRENFQANVKVEHSFPAAFAEAMRSMSYGEPAPGVGTAAAN